MGTWGPGIYSNDTASDVRDLCHEIFPFVSVEEGHRILFEEYKSLLDNPNEDDDDYASFWYGLSDWEWKHGMLRDEIKGKVLSLLNVHAGIAQWQEDASKSDVNKRIRALEKLKAQLVTPQPPFKRPKAAVPKPRHKIGDILILRTSADPVCWTRDSYHISGSYIQDGMFNYVHNYAREHKIYVEYSFQNKYFALLCVGKTHKLYSPHIKDVYKEESIYAVYDYLSDVPPLLEDLTSVGFLTDSRLTFSNEFDWVYKTTIYDSFRSCSSSDVQSVEKLGRYEAETERFEQLLRKKGASTRYHEKIFIKDLCDFFEIPLAYKVIGRTVDTLIDPAVPPMVAPTKEQLDKYSELFPELYDRLWK